MSRVAIGILGAGRMGRLHARVFSEPPLAARFSFEGAFDPALATSANALATPANALAASGLRSFASAEALIAACDVVVVAVPTAIHLVAARAAIAAGRATLVEKPLTATSSEAESLAAFAEARGVPLFTGHSERFNPVIRAMRAWLAREGSAVTEIAIERVVPRAASGSIVEDVLVNLGVHDFDLALHLIGAHAEIVSADGDVADARVELRAERTAITLRAAREGERRRRIRLVTERTILEGNLLSPRLLARDRKGGTVAIVPLPSEEALGAQAIALHDALAGSSSSAASKTIATGRDGARAVALAEEAIALRDRRAITRPRKGRVRA